MPGWDPTIRKLDENQVWENRFYQILVNDISTALATIDGSMCASPFTLYQDLNGNEMDIRGFRRWFGQTAAGNFIVDVCGYGAAGNGSTDDTVAFQSAIDSLGANGGLIIVPPGTYKITRSLRVSGSDSTTRNNVVIRGSGMSSIVAMNIAIEEGAAVFELNTHPTYASGIQIRDLRILGVNADTLPRVGIDLRRTNDAVISGVKIDQLYGYGIDPSESNQARIDNCYFEDFRSASYQCIGSPLMQGVSGLMASGCVFKKLSGSMAPISISGANNTQIRTCTFVGSTAAAITVLTRVGAGCDGVLISDCNIDCGGNLAITLAADNTDSGIYMVSIENNQLDGTIGASAAIPTGLRGISICGNHIYRATVHGISLGKNCQGFVVADNLIAECGQGPSGTGIYCEGEDGAEVQGCVFANNLCTDYQTTKSQDYGIQMGANTKDNVIMGNALDGNAILGLYDLGTNNHVAHNT